MYLELGVDASQIQAQYPMDPTQEPSLNLKSTYLRDYNPLRYDIPVNFNLKKEE